MTTSYGLLGVNRDAWSSNGIETTEREKFDTILEKVLNELEPIALEEQLFCINFFQLDVLSPTSKTAPQTTLNTETTEKSETIDTISGMQLVLFFNEIIEKLFYLKFRKYFTKEN